MTNLEKTESNYYSSNPKNQRRIANRTKKIIKSNQIKEVYIPGTRKRVSYLQGILEAFKTYFKLINSHNTETES